MYGGVCEYKIVSTGTSSPPAFPPCVHSTWGPGDSIDKFSFTPLQTGAIAQTNKHGVADVKVAVVGCGVCVVVDIFVVDVDIIRFCRT